MEDIIAWWLIWSYWTCVCKTVSDCAESLYQTKLVCTSAVEGLLDE